MRRCLQDGNKRRHGWHNQANRYLQKQDDRRQLQPIQINIELRGNKARKEIGSGCAQRQGQE